MTTRTVPTQFATIASADAASSNGDTIALVNGYSNETATLTHNLTVNGDATDTGIVLIMGTGVTSVTLTGTAPITVNDNAGNDSITGNAGNDSIDRRNLGVDARRHPRHAGDPHFFLQHHF